jgi:hypothetical protein
VGGGAQLTRVSRSRRRRSSRRSQPGLTSSTSRCPHARSGPRSAAGGPCRRARAGTVRARPPASSAGSPRRSCRTPGTSRRTSARCPPRRAVGQPARAIVHRAPDTWRRAPQQPSPPRPPGPGAGRRGRPRDAAHPRRRSARAGPGRRLARPPGRRGGGDEGVPVPRLPPADPRRHPARRRLARRSPRRLRRPGGPSSLAHALLVGALASPLTPAPAQSPGFTPACTEERVSGTGQRLAVSGC